MRSILLFKMRILLTTILLVFFSSFTFGGSDESGVEEKFNPTEKVLHHIQDAHDWHLWGDVSIPLPIIFYIDGEVDFFMSSVFHHNDPPTFDLLWGDHTGPSSFGSPADPFLLSCPDTIEGMLRGTHPCSAVTPMFRTHACLPEHMPVQHPLAPDDGQEGKPTNRLPSQLPSTLVLRSHP